MASKKQEEYYIDDEGNVKVKYKGSSFEPVPAGEYDMIIQDVEVRTGKESGNPYFHIEFRISDADPSLDNKVVWENISPVAQWRVTQLVEAVYGKFDDVEEDDEIEFNVFDLFGAKIRARVGLEEIEQGSRKGEMTNTITRFIAADSEPQPEPKKKAPAKKKTTTRRRASTKK